MNCWHVLNLQPTTDLKAVKSAYAKKLKAIDQEKDPGALQALREAFEQARRYDPDDWRADDERATDPDESQTPIEQPTPSMATVEPTSPDPPFRDEQPLRSTPAPDASPLAREPPIDVDAIVDGIIALWSPFGSKQAAAALRTALFSQNLDLNQQRWLEDALLERLVFEIFDYAPKEVYRPYPLDLVHTAFDQFGWGRIERRDPQREAAITRLLDNHVAELRRNNGDAAPPPPKNEKAGFNWWLLLLAIPLLRAITSGNHRAILGMVVIGVGLWFAARVVEAYSATEFGIRLIEFSSRPKVKLACHALWISVLAATAPHTYEKAPPLIAVAAVAALCAAPRHSRLVNLLPTFIATIVASVYWPSTHFDHAGLLAYVVAAYGLSAIAQEIFVHFKATRSARPLEYLSRNVFALGLVILVWQCLFTLLLLAPF